MATSEHRPVLIVIAGPNGSGKTSVTSKILLHKWLENSEYINPDNVARDVFGDWNNQDAVIKAANYCNDWREKCLIGRRNHIFETVMSANDKVDYILRAKEADFFIRLFFVSTESPTINAKRVAKRVLNGFSTGDMTSLSPKSFPVTTNRLPTAEYSRQSLTGSMSMIIP